MTPCRCQSARQSSSWSNAPAPTSTPAWWSRSATWSWTSSLPRKIRRRPARALAPHRSDSELVYELVEHFPGVARDIGEVEPVRLGRYQKLLPQISIGDRFLLRVHPAAPLPAVEPAVGERLHQVGGVDVRLDAGGALQRAQALEQPRDLHPVVGGGGLVAPDRHRPHRAAAAEVDPHGAWLGEPLDLAFEHAVGSVGVGLLDGAV